MTKKNKEQLEETKEEPIVVQENASEEIIEDVKEEEIEEKQEEIVDSEKEEVVSEEKPLEEELKKEEENIDIGKEEPIEEIKEDKTIEEEKIKKEIETTKEELSIIKEVRDELVTLYTNYREVEQLKTQLNSENNGLKEENSFLKEQLVKYKNAEEKLKVKEKLEQLEKLSAKFKLLGQEKTVEYLQTKDVEILSEFEKICDAALDRVGEIKEMPSVTKPSQGEIQSKQSEKLSEEEKKVKEVVKVKKKEQLANPDFFKNICNQLSNEQVGMSGKRVKVF